MKKITMSSDQFFNCPICGNKCSVSEESGYNRQLNMQGPRQVFSCYNPLVNDPLHYYSHVVEKSDPNKIAYQEFSLDLGSKNIMFANNYVVQRTSITNTHEAKPLELKFIIEPDFPYLDSLKKKIRTVITFS